MQTQRNELESPRPGPPRPEFLAAAPAMVRVAEALERAALTDVRTVLCGEAGVGKTHAARYLHRLSARRDGPLGFVSVRDARALARLAAPDFPAELAGGTVVLEGVDEAPPDVQALLLGLIEEWSAPEPGESQVRIIATGQRDLLAAMEEGSFRKDLYYLLDVFPLFIPPLRERTEEIPLFLRHFAALRAPGVPLPELGEAFLAELLAYPWPGNLREVENLVVAAAPGGTRREWALPEALPARGPRPAVPSFARAKREFESAYVSRILMLTSGNVTRAAAVAGKARKDFYALMARNAVDPTQFRGGGPES